MTWLIWLLTIFALVHAQDRTCTAVVSENNRFYQPGKDCDQKNLSGIATYAWGTSIPVTWITNETSVDLTIIQLSANPVNYQKLQVAIPKSTASLSVTLYPTVSKSAPPTFFFAMYVSGGIKPIFNSDIFNVANIPSSASSISSSSTIGPSSPATAQTGTATTSSTATAAPTPTSSGKDSGSSGSGKYIGIGVGAGVGGAIVLAALIWFLLRRRRTKSLDQTSLPLQSPASPWSHNDKASAMTNTSPAWQGTYSQYQQEQQQQQQPLMYNELAAPEHQKNSYTSRPQELEAR